MSIRDIFLALLVITVWGANFTVIKVGVDNISPMLLAGLRYVFTALPAVFFIPRPQLAWKYIIAYGMTVGVGQFSMLFYAISVGMPAGLASVVLQFQAIFTMLFAVFFLKERLVSTQVIGMLVEVGGLYLIGRDIAGASQGTPLYALLLTLLAAAFWAASNIVVSMAAKASQRTGVKLDMPGLVIWSSLIPPVPFFLLGTWTDSAAAIWSELTHLNGSSIFAIVYLSYGATLFGYGMWSVLLGKYKAAKVAPLSLLIPVIGLAIAQVVLQEPITGQQLWGCGIIMLGLVLSLLPQLWQKAVK